VRSDLETTFRALFTDRTRGAVPPFERVVLETSGADDPTPVLQTFLSDRALGREYHLQAVVAVVDAATGAEALDTAPEAQRQVAIADRVVLSKRDLAPAGAAEALETRVRALNPHAPVRAAEHGRVPASFLLADSELPPASALAADAPDGGEHMRDLASFSLLFGRPFAWRTLTAALGLLCEMRGADLLRVKGLVAVEGCRGPVVVHAVRHVLHRPVELEAWPADAPDDRRSRLVFVTRGGLARGPVQDLFRAVAGLAVPGETQAP
jgi:G3E family GTPase